jgi:putative ABC transport system permease protein
VSAFVLVRRLVAGSLRLRPAEALLTVLAIATATTTLSLALGLYGVTNHPYLTTRAASGGPDVVAMDNPGAAAPANGPATATPSPGDPTFASGPAIPRPGAGEALSASDRRALVHLERAGGVAGHAGPFPVSSATMIAHGLKVLAITEGRNTTPAGIDQPVVTDGIWLRNGGVVVERAFAQELGLRPGDRVTLAGRPFVVDGLAVTAAFPPYPYTSQYVNFNTEEGSNSQDTGLVWVSTAVARSFASPAVPLTWLLELKLADPARANTFVAARLTDQQLFLQSWTQIQSEDGQFLLAVQRALLIGASLLAVLAIASLAVVVGGRLAERTRRVGLLKAVGATPRLVAATLLAEYLLLALVAGGAGLVAGWLIEPVLTRPSAGLLGSTGSPSVTLSTIGWVAALACVVALVAALVPSLRAARTTTTDALSDAARSPGRSRVLVAAATRLPVPLLLGLRLAARRPRRMVLTAASLAVTVTTIVAVMTVHVHELAVPAGFAGPMQWSHLTNPHLAEVDEVLRALSIVLGVLAALNAIVITWATWVDSRRPLAVARALGAGPGSVGAGLMASLLLPALPGVIAGIPLGIALVAASSHGASLTLPPASWLVAAALVTLLVLGALSLVPARLGARGPVAAILQSESS